MSPNDYTLFPIYCTADVPTSTPPRTPPTEPFTSPYAGMAPQDLIQIFTAQLSGAATTHYNKTYFAILDERTLQDESALLVALKKDDGANGFETVRVTFEQVQKLLIAWDVACGSVEEVQAIAQTQPGGVYGRTPSPASPPVLEGRPAPRKRLGGGI
ncbi:hypothetical protein M406DRAFT_328895 [Cryphonectria parasitica EP155]|uniref:Uncharacterized protein n=1 Tax=Cryphonectria parasitica (strain ATCC 38755 / EP155) TaxID=660469 RepID=A0A9P5CS68_CRYP1|nr:uncharacterized protein M406DRAFT_328895 [Cryphonectria parasitica EP155]KAF3767840.1 hypothetical protein M406DRAFT_328895 [Cryphonectria parasitica EP155]